MSGHVGPSNLVSGCASSNTVAICGAVGFVAPGSAVINTLACVATFSTPTLTWSSQTAHHKAGT